MDPQIERRMNDLNNDLDIVHQCPTEVVFKFCDDLKQKQKEKKRDESPEFDKEYLEEIELQRDNERKAKEIHPKLCRTKSTFDMQKALFDEIDKTDHLIAAPLPKLPDFSFAEDWKMFSETNKI